MVLRRLQKQKNQHMFNKTLQNGTIGPLNTPSDHLYASPCSAR